MTFEKTEAGRRAVDHIKFSRHWQTEKACCIRYDMWIGGFP